MQSKISFTESIGRIEFILIFLYVLFSLSARFVYNELNSMDEIWNYQFARRVLDGQIPYKDFFIVPAPLAMQINALFLGLFADKLIVMRLVGLFVASINGAIIYLTTRTLGKSRLVSFAAVNVFAGLVFLYPQNNYSWYAVLFLSLALILELNKIKNRGQGLRGYALEIFIGVSLGLAAISKQNIGVIGLAASAAFLYYYTFFINKRQKKKVSLFIKNLTLKVLGWTAVVGAQLFYLWRNDALRPFIDQAVTGTTLFAGEVSIPYTSLLLDSPLLFKLLAVIVPLGIAALFVKGIVVRKPAIQRSFMLVVSMYAAANFAMVYPLADVAHLILAMPLAVVALTLLPGKSTESKAADRKAPVRPVFALITVACFFAVGVGMQPSGVTFYHDIDRFRHIPLAGEDIERLEEVGSFIMNAEQEGQEVFFLNFRAPYYLIPLGNFSYKSDTMFKGNFGSQGEQEILDRLASSENPVAIIRGRNMAVNRQESMVFEDYVRRNMNYATTVAGFEVFVW